MSQSWKDEASPLHPGYLRMLDQDFAEARALLEPVVAETPSADGLYLLSTTIAAEGDWEGSLARADEGLATDPEHTDCFFNRGAALERLGRPEEAVAAYRSALALEPAHVNMAFNLLLLLRRLGRHAEARDVGAAALEHAPDALNLRYKQAETFALLDDPDGARRELERVIAADPRAKAAVRENAYFPRFADRPEWAALLG